MDLKQLSLTIEIERLTSLVRDLWDNYAPPRWVSIPLALVLMYYKFTTWHYGVFKKLGINGPRPFPPFGTMSAMLKKGILEYDKELRKFGKVVGTFHGRLPVLIVFDADMLKAILIKDFSHFRNRWNPEVDEYPMKKMLHFIKDDHWKHVRSTLSPTFSSGKLRRMQQQIETCCQSFISNLQQKADNDEVFDFKLYCGAYTMDVIASTGFGLCIDSHRDPSNIFVQMTNKLFDFSAGNIRVILFLLFPFLIKPLNKLGFSWLPKDVSEFFERAVDQAMEHRMSLSDDKKPMDLLQLMLNAHLADIDDVEATEWDTAPTYIKTTSGIWSRQGLTREEVLAQSLLFFFAGYETTSNTLSLFAYCLAVNSDCQDKLIAEIDQVMQGQDHVTYDILHKMPYLEMCLCEAQRLYPASARTDRVAVDDVTINGVFIPKGMCIGIPIYYLHVDPEVWPEPLQFKPERFSPEAKAARTSCNFLPFGLGPRSCLGQRLALMEIKMAIVHILHKFRFVACPQTEIPITIDKLATRAVNGVNIKVQYR